MDQARRALSLLALFGCGGEPTATFEPAVRPSCTPPHVYASTLESFDPGEGAGFGAEHLPGVVLGPPRGEGGGGSLDVVALGDGGVIVVGFGERRIVDGPGDDFIVFENPFLVRGDRTMPFAELGRVSVSADGEHFVPFPCDAEGDGQGRFPGCAGWRVVETFDVCAPLDPAVAGGDAFDLAAVGLSEARFVRIEDLGGGDGFEPSRGFDLDAVGAVHLR